MTCGGDAESEDELCERRSEVESAGAILPGSVTAEVDYETVAAEETAGGGGGGGGGALALVFVVGW